MSYLIDLIPRRLFNIPAGPGGTLMPSDQDDRREFLKNCGKFAVVTPPVITALLSTSLSSAAIAHSGGQLRHYDHNGHDNNGHDNHHHGNNGWGNGGGDGSPN